MNVLYTDFLTPSGHRRLNKILVSVLSQLATVEIAMPRWYFMECGITQFPCPHYEIRDVRIPRSGRVTSRVQSIKRIKTVTRIMESNKHDVLFASSFDTLSLSWAWPRKSRRRVLAVNHNNLDELRQYVKRKCYASLPTDIEHLVFAEFMKDYLVEQGIRHRIWVIHHPVVPPNTAVYQSRVFDETLVIAPGGHNDEQWIRELVERQRRDRIFQRLGAKVIIKSRTAEYRDDCMYVHSFHWTDSEYNALMARASVVLLPYSRGYRYRISGILFDCVAHKKRFLASRSPFFTYFSERYPGAGYTFDSVDECLGLLESMLGNASEGRVFERIANEHSTDVIIDDLRKILFSD